jgi:hypothetical protein
VVESIVQFYGVFDVTEILLSPLAICPFACRALKLLRGCERIVRETGFPSLTVQIEDGQYATAMCGGVMASLLHGDD